MTDEERLKKSMDRLNQNSHYGIIIDTEITKLVRSHIKRLEDNEMKATSVQNIKNVKDVCFNISNNPLERESKFTLVASTNDDIFAFEFEGPDLLQSCKRAGLFTGWEKDQKIKELEEEVSRWKKEAADCLRLRDEAQKEAYKLKKENEKYEEKIKKLEHDDMLDKNAADYWSKEHDILLKRFAKLQVENERNKENLNSQHEMIKELNQKNLKLQEENEKLRDKIENVEPFRALERTIKEKQQLKEEYEDLQHKYDLERAANEAQHKFFIEYAGKGTEIEFNYAIENVNEVSYVILDKDEYQNLKDNGYRAKIHDEIYTVDQLVDRVLELEEENNRLHDTAKEGDYVCLNSVPYSADDIKKLKEQIKKLEELKTPIIENFADDGPSSRRDILRCAEKCVCGKREQDYGTPESNFQLIADLWNGYLGLCENGDGVPIFSIKSITPTDVAMMMALMKIARIRNGGGSGDSFVDLAGYAACGGEIWHTQNHKDQK